MVQVEYPYMDNTNWVRYYSDSNKKIIQIETGNVYSEAVDIYPSRFTYKESDEDLEEEENK